ncbi:PREDICTED: uncharacterized protein LOC105461423, partial [Wasmannia auropunctata]|uniref:uncharacterized protein LOC105461423 n=1 Tax=Wasmannia auropunctata TaxID=64793 RepID=UPI0005F00878
MYRQNSFYRLSTLLNLYEDSKCINNKNFKSFKNIVHRAVNKSPVICYELFHDFTPCEMTKFNKLNEICLDIASKHGLTIFVKSLLRDGVNPNRVNKFFKSAPIHFATKGGHVDTLEALLAEPTINPNLQAGQMTALHIAVIRNDRICASMLLQKGANANILCSEDQCSALYLASVTREFNMVELILRKHKQNLDSDNYKKAEQMTRDMIQNLFGNLLVTATENDLRTAGIKILDSFRIIDWFHIDNPIEKYVFRDTMFDISAEQERKNDRKRLEQNQLIIKRAADVAVDKNRYVLLRELLNAMIAPKIVNNDFIIKVCKQLKQLK